MTRFLPVVALLGCGSEYVPTLIHPEMAVLPEALDYGEVVANEERPTLEVYVDNPGPVDLQARLAVEGPDASAFAVLGEATRIVGPDRSVTVPVEFAPTELRPYAADLVVRSNDPEHQLWVVPLTGTGRVPYAPEIEVAPAELDFGSTTVALVDFVQVVNAGDADLVLGSVTQDGAGLFALVADPSGQRIPPGQAIPLQVAYTHVPGIDGASGNLYVPSNDADEPVVTIPLLVNGGGAFAYPDAVIDCPGAVDLAGPIVVTLDGSASTDAGSPPLTYAWSVVRRPSAADATRAPEPADAPVADLLVDAAGTWEVQLVVTNADGIPSVPEKCVIEAVPVDQLHVELSWSGATSDLDLHVAEGDAGFYEVPGDVSWCNTNPDWGTPGNPDDDGSLDQDDDEGYGPENVNVPEPADGTYAVRVHVYDDGDDGAVTATVSVFTNGSLAWTGSKVLARNDVWEVGQVNWPQGTFGVGSEDPWDAEGVRECD